MWSMRLLKVTSLLVVLAVCSGGTIGSPKRDGGIDYPNTTRDETIFDYFNGMKVLDPYRWLEASGSEETKAFIKQQNDISEKFFDSCPFKDKIRETLNKNANYTKYGCPKLVGGKYYFFKNDGLQNQAVMYVQDGPDSAPSVFLDPNDLSEDGTVSLTNRAAFSPDGLLYAYALSIGGSDTMTIKIRDTASGVDLPDAVEFVYYSGVIWSPDSQGFFYSAKKTNVWTSHAVYYHSVGSKQTDNLAFRASDHSDWYMEVKSAGESYVILHVSNNVMGNGVYLAELQKAMTSTTDVTSLKALVDGFDDWFQFITHMDQKFYHIVRKDAPYNKLVAITPEGSVEEIVSGNRRKGVLYDAVRCGRNLVLHYSNVTKSELYIYNLATSTHEKVDVEEMSYVECVTTEQTNPLTFFKVTSFLNPGRVYSLDTNTNTKTLFFGSTVNFNPNEFTTKQLFYKSKDNTDIPMFVVHKKDLVKSGNHPVLMRGFGSFAYSLRPVYHSNIVTFLQHMGGVFVIASIRGGSEYGDEWYRQALREKKQVAFDDFLAAAEFLIRIGYTKAEKLAIYGSGSGGLLVGACMNQRPDLFAAGITKSALLDMLRYHKYGSAGMYVTEYGSSENASQFPCLHSYSPLHNIPRQPSGGQYPATLVMAGDKDNRVYPAHSLKFMAELQHTVGDNENQENPLLLRIDTNTGHGEWTPTTKRIAEKTDFYSFLCQTLDLEWSD